MPALDELRKLPHLITWKQSTTTYPPADEARLWGEEDARQAIRLSVSTPQNGALIRTINHGLFCWRWYRNQCNLKHDPESSDRAGLPAIECTPVPDEPLLFIAIADDDKCIPSQQDL
jgi:hypothetical protein